jgi:hypothetical protein
VAYLAKIIAAVAEALGEDVPAKPLKARESARAPPMGPPHRAAGRAACRER